MYEIVLILHNLLRWAVVLFAVWALARALRGWLARQDWTSADRSAGLLYTIAIDTQVLLGLILYVGLSPLMKVVWSDIGNAMRTSELRFFFVEHLPFMVLAAVFAHIGSNAGKTDLPGKDKHRRAAIWYGLSIIAILLGTPWFRPLLPF